MGAGRAWRGVPGMQVQTALDRSKRRDSPGIPVQTAFDIVSCTIAWVLHIDSKPNR